VAENSAMIEYVYHDCFVSSNVVATAGKERSARRDIIYIQLCQNSFYHV
jgi:hypothetical protein